MVEFTEEEQKRYAERLRLRAELKEKQAKEADEKINTLTKAAIKDQNRRKGFLEKVADKAEGARARYDRVKEQTGRITKAVSPAPKARGPAKGKMPRQLRAYAYRPKAPRRIRQPAYQPRQRNDAFSDMINGPRSYSNSGGGFDAYNDLIKGKPSVSKPGFDHNDLIFGKSSKGKKKGDDFFKDLLG